MSNTFKIKTARKINRIYNSAKSFANSQHFNVMNNFNSKFEELIKKSEFKSFSEIEILKYLRIVENNSTNMKRKGISKIKKVTSRNEKRSHKQRIFKEVQNSMDFED